MANQLIEKCICGESLNREIKNNKITKEWTGFNELAILMQILGDK